MASLVRSYLFVPGDRADMLAKAHARGADALIVDLEDGVAESQKESARLSLLNWLKTRRKPPTQVWVRINSEELGREDLDSLEPVPSGAITGFVVPKVNSEADVSEVIRRQADTSLQAGLIVLVETARALRNIHSLAEMDGLSRLMIGEADLGAEIGLAPNDPAWDSLRVDLVVASAAAGLDPPIGPVDSEFSDLTAFRSRTERLRSLGFGARGVIHPAQLSVVHEVFMPTDEEIENARQLIREHDKRLADGIGTYVDGQGRMVDEAFIRRARRIVSESGDPSARV